MCRGALQKLHRRSRYEKRTKLVFCTQSKKGSENQSSHFEPKISWISFSRGSGPPLMSRSALLRDLSEGERCQYQELFPNEPNKSNLSRNERWCSKNSNQICHESCMMFMLFMRIQNGEGCVGRWQTVAAPTASWGEDAPHLAMGRVPCDLHQLCYSEVNVFVCW